MTSIKQLEEDIRIAHENGIKYLIVGLLVYKGKEMIIIERDNFIEKLEYYKKTYDDNLVMKTNKDIKIITYMFSDNVNIDVIDITNAS